MHGMLREPVTHFTLSKSMIWRKYLLLYFVFAASVVDAGTLSKAQTAYEQKNYASAYTQFSSLQGEESGRACYYLGIMNQQGWGIIADPAKAAVFYECAGEKSHIKALHNLAGLYHRGLGVPQDLDKALELYRRSAGQGGAKAAHRLGLIYFQGDGVPRDFVLAREWWQKAFERGEADSGYNLGILYRRGLGIARDQIRALQLWMEAGALGSAHAQNAYGSALMKAEGIAYNPIQAYAWFRAAAVAGLPVARTNAELVWESLPPDAQEKALTEADALITSFQK